jgi:hypothetical protein
MTWQYLMTAITNQIPVTRPPPNVIAGENFSALFFDQCFPISIFFLKIREEASRRDVYPQP